MEGKLIGVITHFYNNICVAVFELKGDLKVGDEIHILGHSTDFHQVVKSLQIEHKQIEGAGRGEEVALKVDMRVHRGDKVYKLTSGE